MSSPRPRCLTVRTNLPVSTLRNPTTVLRAFLPLMMTSACSPTLLHAALKGGNSLRLVSSPNHTSPPASSTSLTRRITSPFYSRGRDQACQARISDASNESPTSVAKGPSSRWSGSPSFVDHPPQGVRPKATRLAPPANASCRDVTLLEAPKGPSLATPWPTHKRWSEHIRAPQLPPPVFFPRPTARSPASCARS